MLADLLNESYATDSEIIIKHSIVTSNESCATGD